MTPELWTASAMVAYAVVTVLLAAATSDEDPADRMALLVWPVLVPVAAVIGIVHAVRHMWRVLK